MRRDGLADNSEACHTKPTARCPHPQYWTAPDAHATEHEVTELVAAFVRAIQPELVVETGTHRGYTAAAIGAALKRNGHGRLVTFETTPKRHTEASERCEGLPVDCRLGSSLGYQGAPGSVGFAWFDSLTSLRLQEFDLYVPWMIPGAVVGFHDTAPHHGGWSTPVRNHPRLNVIELSTPRGVMFGTVK